MFLIVVMGGVVATAAKGFLGISNFSKASIDQELGSVADRTGEGRSEFHPVQVNSPVQFPLGVFTVMFRPMPYEAHSPQELRSLFENLAVLLGVFVFSAGGSGTPTCRARRRPYLLYCIGVISTFVVEYSTFSNFAIIARERTQVTSLLLVFLMMPREGSRRRRRRPRSDRRASSRRPRTLRDPARWPNRAHPSPSARTVALSLRYRVTTRCADLATQFYLVSTGRAPPGETLALPARPRTSSCETTRRGHRCAVGDEAVLTVRHRADLLPVAMTEIDRASVATSADEVVLLHASAVLGAEGPVLLVGPSGAGKSTLSAVVTRRGWTYVGDEVIGLDEHATEAFADPKPWKLDRGARAAVVALGNGAGLDDDASER